MEANFISNIYIVTNATKDWVDSCLREFYPKLNKYIEDESIPIISARDNFSKQAPNNVNKWKVY